MNAGSYYNILSLQWFHSLYYIYLMGNFWFVWHHESLFTFLCWKSWLLFIKFCSWFRSTAFHVNNNKHKPLDFMPFFLVFYFTVSKILCEIYLFSERQNISIKFSVIIIIITTVTAHPLECNILWWNYANDPSSVYWFSIYIPLYISTFLVSLLYISGQRHGMASTAITSV